MADIDHNALFGPDSGAPQPGVTLGGSGAPVDMDALFGTSPPVKSGWVADLTTAQSPAGRVLHAFGVGAEDAWGSAPLAASPVQDFLRKQGGWDDYAEKQGGVLKGFNEGVLRPLAASLDENITGPAVLAGRILGAGASATFSGMEQGAQETKGIPYAGPVLSTALGGGAEIGEKVLTTAEPELAWMHELSTAAKATNLSKARATAVIGEGEEGFFNTVPPTEQQIAQRTEAATESGVPVQQAVAPKPVPTVDELARRVDPETFTQYDEFARQRQETLDRFNELAEAHVQTPEAQAAQAKIDTIMDKVSGVESRLTGAARARLADAQDELEGVLRQRTPEMESINAQRTEASYQMQRLYSRVQDAYDHAQTLLPDAERMAQAGFDVGVGPVEGYLPDEQIAQADAKALDQHEAAIDQHVARVAPDVHEDMANEGIADRTAAQPTPVRPPAESRGQAGSGPALDETGQVAGGGGGEATGTGESGISRADLEPTRRSSFATEHRVAPELEPRPATGGTVGFKTAKGSTYELHEDGTTTRNKAARADVGHEGDSGVKSRTAKTVYVDDPKMASALSAAGLENLGSKGARVIIKDGKASMLTWNEKAGRWGVSSQSKDIPISTEPGVGKAPLELWKPTDDVPGHPEAYRGMHAGNEITELKAAESAAPKFPGITQGTGELKPFGISKSIEANAIEKGLVASFGDDVPMRQAVNFADQANKIFDLMRGDQAGVMDMIRGNRAVPGDIVPQLLLNAVEDHAYATGDVQLLRELANSPIARATSEAGLTLRAARERQDFSVSNAIREVQDARAGFEKSGAIAKTEAVVKEAQAGKAAIRKLTSADKLLDFVKSIQCEV